MFALLALAVLAPIPQRLGLALNVPQGGGAEEFVAAMRQQIRLGLDGEAISLKWDEYESQNGKPLDDGINGAKFMGQKALLTIATIDTTRRRLPADLSTAKWDDPKLLDRFDRFLESIAPKIRDQVLWVSLGNEVNVYLAAHPDELGAYQKFLAHGRETLRRLVTELAVGVTVTDGDGIKSPELVRTLESGMDVAVFTFYPMNGMQVLPPTDVAHHFQFMKQIAGDRPLLLQEIGYPASPLNGSSDEKQAEFVGQVFKELEGGGSKIPLACFFIQTDFADAQLGFLDTYYGISDPTFHSFLGSLGLHDNSGKPRKAWSYFMRECMKLKPVE